MKYDYGDDIMLRADESEGNIAQKVGTVVGITLVENAEQARSLNHPIGTVLYTVEFGDGSDALVSEQQLTPLSFDSP